MSGVTSSFIGAVQQVFVNGVPLSLYDVDTAKCAIVQDEEKLPCSTTGVTRYTGPPCGEGELFLIIQNLIYMCPRHGVILT